MGCECLRCKHADVVTDNHEEHHSICICRESENFLKPISIVWDSCEHGEVERYEEETEGEK